MWHFHTLLLYRMLKQGLRVWRKPTCRFDSTSTASNESPSSIPPNQFIDFVDTMKTANPITPLIKQQGGYNGARNVESFGKYLSSQSKLEGLAVVETLRAAVSITDNEKVKELILESSAFSPSVLSATSLDVSSSLIALSLVINLGLGDSKLASVLNGKVIEQLAKKDALSCVTVNALNEFVLSITRNKWKLSAEMKKIVHNLMNTKISDFSKASELLTLLSCTPDLPVQQREWWNMISQKALSLLPVMSLPELVSLMNHYSIAYQRDPALLRTITHHITRSLNTLTINQISTLASACGRLGFNDARLLRKISADLVVDINTVKNWADISAIAKSFAKIRLGDPSAWSAICQWTNANLDTAKPKTLGTVVTAMARIGYKDGSTAASHLSSILIREYANGEDAWLNSMHSLAYYNVLTPQMAESVLSREFTNELVAKDWPLPRKLYCLQRIMRVDAYVSIHMKGYMGPRFDHHVMERVFKEEKVDCARTVKHGKSKNDADFLSIFYLFAPRGTHCRVPYVHKSGVYIEGEILTKKIGDKMLAIPVDQWNSFSLSRPILFFDWSHTHHSIDSVSNENNEDRLLGDYQFALKMLRESGVNPFVVFNSDFSTYKQRSDAVAWLKEELAV